MFLCWFCFNFVAKDTKFWLKKTPDRSVFAQLSALDKCDFTYYHLIFFPSSFCCAVYLMVSMSRIEQESVVYYYSTWIFGKLRNIIMQSQFGGVSMRKLRERERLPSSFRKYISILIGLKWTENDRPNGRNSTTKRTKWHILSICSRRTF